MSINYIYDNDIDDNDILDEYILDSSWIQDIENKIIHTEYSKFIIDDITSLPITFIYLNKKKEIVHSAKYNIILKVPNQISQAEILHIIQKYQIRMDSAASNMNKKGIMLYYNFYSMIHYSFYVKEDPKSISLYLLEDDLSDSDNDNDNELNNEIKISNSYTSPSSYMKEYSNIVSIHTLLFKPSSRLFNDISSLTIILIED